MCGGRDGALGKSTGWLSRGPRFGFQDSQPQGIQYLLLVATGIAYTWCTEIYAKTHIKLKIKGNKKNGVT